MPRPLARGHRCKPLLEILEDRATPALLLTGDPTALEGTPYAITLQDPDSAGVIAYDINWGDGETQTVAAADVPADGLIEHVYADGPNQYTITVQSVTAGGLSAAGAYSFNGTLDEADDGPALIKLVNNTQNGPVVGTVTPADFVTDTVFGESRTVYQFGLRSGLSLDTTNILPSDEEYTIEMVFRYNDVAGWQKFLDFNNLSADLDTGDNGVYVFNNTLQFYPHDPSTQPLLSGYNRIVVTRSDADDRVVMYLNGQPVSFRLLGAPFGTSANSFIDAGGIAKIPANKILHFLLDDRATAGGETSSGRIAQIRLFDTALSAQQVADLGNAGGGSGGGESASLDVAILNSDPSYTPAANQSGFRAGDLASIDLGAFADLGLLDGPWSVNVSWGDGNSQSFNVDGQGALGSHGHAYAAGGLYTVQVSVTDKDGGSASGTFQVLSGLGVINTNDSGFGSLRAAIEHANALAGPDVVEFDIGSGAQTIVLASALPAVTEAVVFDGWSQPGFAGVPLVSIDGGGHGGLDIVGGDSTVRGLGFDNFTGAAINLEGGGNNQVLGNRFGPGIAVAIHGLSAGNVVGAPGDGLNTFDNAAVVFADAGHVALLKVDATDDGFLEVSKDTTLVATLHGVSDVQLQAAGGIDKAVVVGTSDADHFEIHADGVMMNGVSVTSSDAAQWVARGKQGKDTFVVVDADAPFTLKGGAGADLFSFLDGAGITGVVDGGGGVNVLDYSAWTSAVHVDLGAGTATATGGVVNVGHVIGGSGNDCLIGDDGSNVLVGGAGDDYLSGRGGADALFGGSGNDILLGGAGVDLLFGEGGRDLLIGGAGLDLLDGGSGDDLLIGGTTAFDDNRAALDAIMAIWTRADLSYKDRVRMLTTNCEGSCEVRLSNNTVWDDCAVDILLGGGGDDLFGLGKLDLPLDWNPIRESVFQYRK